MQTVKNILVAKQSDYFILALPLEEQEQCEMFVLEKEMKKRARFRVFNKASKLVNPEDLNILGVVR